MQTMNISGTVLAGQIRRNIADASSALNAQKKEEEKAAKEAASQERQERIDTRKEELDKAKIAREQAQTDLYRARANELRSKAEARDVKTERLRDIGTPQSKEIVTKVERDMDWVTLRSGLIVPKDMGGVK